LVGTTKVTRCRGAFQISARSQPQAFKALQLQLHFSERSHISGAAADAFGNGYLGENSSRVRKISNTLDRPVGGAPALLLLTVTV